MSFGLLEKYLGVVSAGFVGVEDCGYKLTERGREFLKQYKLFNEHYFGAQKLLEALGCEREMLALLCEDLSSLVG